MNPSPKIPFKLLKNLPHSPQIALKELSGLMTDSMLKQISVADYGMGADECLRYLQTIVDAGKTPEQVKFILTECLELTRWITPESKEEHLTRAFSTVLLLILQNTSNYESISDENETLASLLDSCTAMNISSKAVQALIVWRILKDYEEEKVMYLSDESSKDYVDEISTNDFFIYGLLVCLVFNQEEERAIDRVADWLIDMDKDSKNMAPFYSKQRAEHMSLQQLTRPFLLGQTDFKQRHDLWKKLSKQLLDWKSYIQSEQIHQKLETIVDCIVHEKVMKH
ncbi:hypothetical protein BKI52_01900 [marine bacterium AO1-C]|nr:hypothetical protein BKI52_01900 [marine bacterium AO1-C]